MMVARGPTVRILGDDPVGEAADEIASRITLMPAMVMTLPTGHTFSPIYARWGNQVGNNVRFPDVRGIQLDEYLDLAESDPRRFAMILERELFAPRVFDRRKALLMVPQQDETMNAAFELEPAIASMGGLDLALLGLGINGHVAFNEPGSAADSISRQVSLASSSRARAAADFNDRLPPAKAFTLGLATLLSARSIIIVAFGTAKTDAVAACIAGAVGPDCPASFFQNHSDATILVDRAAAARLADLAGAI